ncbi:hypothetical protein K505DRAFT_337848 [Melanomma pulvis-pyrius CBS 109.77]|uniref:BTB domain-containing protein n=1 Tax=Melanomma pulvis-pyrius CBS 109.77 TaxID=1314802 RepID=A0A6A6XAF1_9PLEO|nr:hypothetical protein K505DRAFT_337848 [Melanomma pulvis-pyrius CBS 109.77]
MANPSPLRDQIELWITSPMVGLQAGTPSTTATTFQVHEALLRCRSRHCASILRRADTVDAVFSRAIHLPFDAEVVATYVQSLYSNALLWHIPSALWLKGIGNNNRLARLYVLAEYLQDAKTTNAVLAAMVQASAADVYGVRSLPSPSMVAILYRGTREESPMRRFLVDVVAGFAKEHWWPGCEGGELPQEFLFQLGREMVRRRGAIMGAMDAADYLEVEDGGGDALVPDMTGV